jgi:hypothetical protein
MRFIIVYPAFCFGQERHLRTCTYSGFYTLYGLANKHAWDSNYVPIVSEAATAYML